jgi:hypothetical protein
MAKKGAHELREAARNYRDMCADCGDMQLKAALLLLADEFEREAESPPSHAVGPSIPKVGFDATIVGEGRCVPQAGT